MWSGCVWFLWPKSLGRFKAESRWGEGIWLGFRDESNEIFVGTVQGVVKVRTVRRKGTAQSRWDGKLFNSVKGTPWQPDIARNWKRNSKWETNGS